MTTAVVTSYVRAESLRLLRRRRTWVLLVAAAAVVVLFGYVLVSALAELATADPQLDDESRQELSRRVSGTGLSALPSALSGVAGQFVAVLGLLSGSLLLAEDHRSGFLKLLVARGVPRRELMLAKIGAAAVFALVGTVVAACAGVVGSVLVVGVAGPGPDPTALVLVLAAVGAAWWLWAVVGLLLTAAARSGVAALAFAGVLLVGGTVLAALPERDDVLGSVAAWLPMGLTTDALAHAAAGQAGGSTGALGLLLVATGVIGLLAVRVAVRQDLR